MLCDIYTWPCIKCLRPDMSYIWPCASYFHLAADTLGGDGARSFFSESFLRNRPPWGKLGTESNNSEKARPVPKLGSDRLSVPRCCRALSTGRSDSSFLQVTEQISQVVQTVSTVVACFRQKWAVRSNHVQCRTTRVKT